MVGGPSLSPGGPGLGLTAPLPRGDFIPVPSGTGRTSLEPPPGALSRVDIALY